MRETKADDKIAQPAEDASALWLDELKQSHLVLQKLIAALPPDIRPEFIELLRILAEGDEAHGSFPSALKKVGQIVTELCRQDQANNKSLPQEPEEPERRAGERRNQYGWQGACNAHTVWTTEQIGTLRNLAEQNMPIRRIARRLGRTSAAIESKAKEFNVRLNHVK
ncbi:MAG: hypothetical protein H0X43_06435 [Nitrosospira sp.]|nr:hypothetical protein [Nitrosospira sp.]